MLPAGAVHLAECLFRTQKKFKIKLWAGLVKPTKKNKMSQTRAKFTCTEVSKRTGFGEVKFLFAAKFKVFCTLYNRFNNEPKTN